jgi:putative transcriptional regulator
MSWTRFQRVVLSLGVLVLSAVFTAPARPTPEPAQSATSLVGQLLIASPDMGDPNFYHAVILMVQHSKDGALGIVINRPAGELPLADLMKAIGQDTTGIVGSVRIFAGGPVEPQIGFVVHSTEYHRAETVDIDGRVAMTSNPEVLRDIGHGEGPKKSLVAFGYTGWGPGQLEAEMARHAWFTATQDPTLIFDTDRQKVWEAAMARREFPL